MSAFYYELLSLEISGRRGIGLKFFGSNLDPFLNSGFSLDTLQDSGTDDNEMERFIRS